MADPTAQTKPNETPKAALAFRDYLALGPVRSLRLLAEHYVNQKYYKTIGTATITVSNWSRKYNWQERITSASTAQSDVLLKQAAELDADTFLKSSRRLNEDMSDESEPETEVVIKIRESVRKPSPKGTSTVDVNVSVDIAYRQIAERIASERGLDVEDVLAEADRLLARARS